MMPGKPVSRLIQINAFLSRPWRSPAMHWRTRAETEKRPAR